MAGYGFPEAPAAGVMSSEPAARLALNPESRTLPPSFWGIRDPHPGTGAIRGQDYRAAKVPTRKPRLSLAKCGRFLMRNDEAVLPRSLRNEPPL